MMLCALSGLVPASAQQPPTESLKNLLPAGAEIIETADLSAIARKPRLMVLWMLRPKRNLDGRIYANNQGGSCSDVIHGDFGKFWEGPTRLSLFDSEEMRLINTLKIPEGCPGCKEGRDTLTIPLCVLNPNSRVRNPGSDRAGKPNLDLRDITGEGLNAEFTLLVFEAYGIASTAVFGYEPNSDLVVQYPIEILHSSKRPLTTLWTEQVFATEPVRPGFWKFTWEPGHGDPGIFDEEVSFDRTRRLFVQKEAVRLPKVSGR